MLATTDSATRPRGAVTGSTARPPVILLVEPVVGIEEANDAKA
ncbi:hypothetical protein [Arthrobacter humicola]